jgi:hypothetical protein
MLEQSKVINSLFCFVDREIRCVVTSQRFRWNETKAVSEFEG